jgi:Uri superfamily endonuclease
LTEKTPTIQNDTGWITPDAVDRLSSGPGAYGLLIRLKAPFSGKIGALGSITLPPGTYLYLGSAYGPGGLPARLRRHLRKDKRLHWHVDYLTNTGTIEQIFVLPEGQECDLADRALQLSDVHVPVSGFGSSDCRRCAAHLLAVPMHAVASMF